MLYTTVMAGGSGTRFWPASRKKVPKQLLKLVGDRSMLQQTMQRLSGLCVPENTLVITNEILVAEIARQLPELPANALIGEPAKRDTAPCVGLAAALNLTRDPDATMLVMPADHVIQPREAFHEAIRLAEELVEQEPKRLVTFGVPPTYPAEVYGYIERGKELPISGKLRANQVVRFREKPDASTARLFVASGEFSWNSGIFVWKARTLLEALREYEPEMVAHLERIASAWGTPEFAEIFRDAFLKIKGISIDFAVMERYPDVVVIEAPFEWDDVGNWTSLERLNPSTEEGNTVLGQHLGVRTTNSIIVGGERHLIATIGVDDLIIVQTADATLVAKKSDEAAVKQIVEAIERSGWTEYM